MKLLIQHSKERSITVIRLDKIIVRSDSGWQHEIRICIISLQDHMNHEYVNKISYRIRQSVASFIFMFVYTVVSHHK